MPLLKVGDKLGEMLVEAKLVTPDQLAKALEVQRGTTKRIGEILVELNLVSEMDIMMALSKQLGVPYATRASGLLAPPKDQKLEKLIPAEFARQHLLLPLSRHLDSLTVVCVDPLDLITMDNLSRLTGCEISPVITTKRELEQAINEFYGEPSMLREAIGRSYQMSQESASTSEEDEEVLSLDRLKQAAEEAPVIRLVDLIIHEALKDRASDIHIEPFKEKLTVRYRIDGVLYEISPPAKQLRAAIVSRIKILSKLDIAEKRLPQDGAFTMMLEGQAIDFRVSSIPTIYGEKVVIRILRKSPELLDLGQLGFEAKERELFRKAIQEPYGLILITGPTGSGKTTTLYAALNEIKSPKRNILTAEDPVEYRLDGVNQLQVKPAIGLTFARGLRAFLRQDPDVILVGETRDLETAEVCVQSALTGHLVFSTLHTNDAPAAVTRLVNIGVAPYLVSSTLSLIAAQRLLRRLCDRCREAYEPVPAIREQFGLTEELLYRAKGCQECNRTGYHGRAAVYEIMAVNQELRNLIARNEPAHVLKEAAVRGGMTTLWQSGLKKVQAGLTSLEELESVVLLEKVE
ncbi:MAG: Flp pilus assembly complex ATPase component TadA [Candidatus Omnitrophica bacterium]|nr:Flp pilus assembly complex ATPase component TadA [Candidatus Omnitrophota bacterium]